MPPCLTAPQFLQLPCCLKVLLAHCLGIWSRQNKQRLAIMNRLNTRFLTCLTDGSSTGADLKRELPNCFKNGLGCLPHSPVVFLFCLFVILFMGNLTVLLAGKFLCYNTLSGENLVTTTAPPHQRSGLFWRDKQLCKYGNFPP